MSRPSGQVVLDALLDARSLLHAQARRSSGALAILRPLLVKIEQAIGAALPRTREHDEGACARCSLCGRYTSNVLALSSSVRFLCDCGEADGWCGSFERPDDASSWSIGERE